MKPVADSHPEIHRTLAWYYLKMTLYHFYKSLNPNDARLTIPNKPKDKSRITEANTKEI